MVAAVLFISLVVFIFLNIPISISLGLSSVLALIASGSPLGVIPSMMQATVQKFSLLTIPLFVLAGVLMDKGGISKRLINLADSMMGPVHGGLGYISVICALFFAAISGSGTATVAAMGSILIPAMVKQGYDAGFSSALSAISGSLGTVIPPSITFIIYGMITGESISDLFLAGIVPGIIFALILCLTVLYYSVKNDWKGDTERSSGKEILKAFLNALPGFLSPVIVLGGIYSGIFTPTEAAAVAAKGKAEAEAIQAKAEAEAAGILKKAEAMKQYGDAARQQMELDTLKVYFEQLPKIAEAVAKGYMNVDSIKMFGGDSSKLAGDIMTTVTQVTDGIKESTGLDINEMLAKGFAKETKSEETGSTANADYHEVKPE